MKKILKSGLTLACCGLILFSSGCSCSVKQEKIDEHAKKLADSDLLKSKGLDRDFTATYKVTREVKKTEKNDNGEDVEVTVNETTTYIVTRDADSQIYEFSETKPNSETVTYTTYTENNEVYLKKKKNNALLTGLGNTLHVYKNGATLMGFDYYANTALLYEEYKTVLKNGCASAANEEESLANRENLPDIHVNFVRQAKCAVEKKLFGKEYTYVVNYRVAIDRVRTVTIIVKDDAITQIKIEDKTSTEGNITQELLLSYDDVKLEKPTN